MRESIDDISINELLASSEQLAQLAGIIGRDAIPQIIAAFGGSTIYIPMAESVGKQWRDKRIRARFNGRNFKELANEYRLSIRQVRNIVNRI